MNTLLFAYVFCSLAIGTDIVITVMNKFTPENDRDKFFVRRKKLVNKVGWFFAVLGMVNAFLALIGIDFSLIPREGVNMLCI